MTDRESLLNSEPVRKGRCVLYWMQASQRATENPALDAAIARANSLDLPVLCVFGLTASYPEANLRHYAFMIEGLAETRASLARMGITLAVLRAEPDVAALSVADQAALIVCDCGYLRHQRRWRARVAKESPCAVLQVESDVVVPVAAASTKAEWSAATLRPKILKLRDRYLAPAPAPTTPARAAPILAPRPKRDSLGISVPGAVSGLDGELLESLPLDRSIAPAEGTKGGTSRALALLHSFIEEKLPFYADERNDPGLDTQSGLSPYLVRRELSMNFVAHTAAYDSFSCLPAWARGTLAAHARDRRPHQYSARQLEEGRTHDPYWNAAMLEMRLTGRLHGSMRMYWGKKIIEWSPSPAAAFRTALRLNNRYFLDGRDPNSYAGVAWCFGLHDRPWQERPIFGMVRYMNESGLRRKFDIEGYVRRIESLGKERS